MRLYKAGNEIDAFCTKCKMDLLHKVVAEVKGVPKKVECRTCYTTHVYRAPKGAHSPGALPPPSTSASSSGGSTAASRAEAAAARKRAEEIAAMPVVPPDHAKVHMYRMTEKFLPDMWVMHKTFGTGQVMREVAPDKIEVRFDGGPRILVHNKPES